MTITNEQVEAALAEHHRLHIADKLGDDTRFKYMRSILEAAEAARVAAHSAPAADERGVDVQALIEAVLPGGYLCDPQRVADDIREWFAERADKTTIAPPRPGPADFDSWIRTSFPRLFEYPCSNGVNDGYVVQVARAAWQARAQSSAAPVTHPADARDGEKPLTFRVHVATMRESCGESYWVCIDRSDLPESPMEAFFSKARITPYKTAKREQADYEAAVWSAFLCGTGHPDLLVDRAMGGE